MIYYTYEIYDPVLNMKYIGSRTNKNVKSIESDSSYMGSVKSKEWAPLWKEITKRCTKTILQVFENKQQALEHEIYLHKLYDIDNNEEFFNKSKLTSTKFTCVLPPRTKEHNENISKAKKGIIPIWTEESKEMLIQKKIGKNNPMYGKKVMRTICEYCDKDVAKNTYIQWHGEKCKFK